MVGRTSTRVTMASDSDTGIRPGAHMTRGTWVTESYSPAWSNQASCSVMFSPVVPEQDHHGVLEQPLGLEVVGLEKPRSSTNSAAPCATKTRPI